MRHIDIIIIDQDVNTHESKPYFSLSHENQNVYNIMYYIDVGMPLEIVNTKKCRSK